MTITERTLKRWRKESLMLPYAPAPETVKGVESTGQLIDELNRRIIRMTQELLDQHLIRKG